MSRTLSRLTGLADSHAVAAVIAAVAVAACHSTNRAGASSKATPPKMC